MNNVAAIVVTYNRLELLMRCIKSLRNQTYSGFDIVVVNNGSTDGTKEWLDSLCDVYVINQDNCGGAGGFFAGQKYAYDKGYEWVWMMDDDGLADKDELKELMLACHNNNFWYANATVVNVSEPKHLAFAPTVETNSLKGEYINDYFSPYNGTIIKRDLIKEIGFIKKEMFIWGDEIEYSLRASRFGYKGVTVVKAIHFHPQNKGIIEKVLPFFNYSIVRKPKHLSKYYFLNRGYIEKNYADRKTLMMSYIFYSLFYLRKMEFGELFKFWKYYTRGIHNEYL